MGGVSTGQDVEIVTVIEVPGTIPVQREKGGFCDENNYFANGVVLDRCGLPLVRYSRRQSAEVNRRPDCDGHDARLRLYGPALEQDNGDDKATLRRAERRSHSASFRQMSRIYWEGEKNE